MNKYWKMFVAFCCFCLLVVIILIPFITAGYGVYLLFNGAEFSGITGILIGVIALRLVKPISIITHFFGGKEYKWF